MAISTGGGRSLQIHRAMVACLLACDLGAPGIPGASPGGTVWPPSGAAFAGMKIAAASPSVVEPYSRHPSETGPYAACPPPTRERVSCMAAVVPTRQGGPVTGPSLEGNGQLGGFSPGDLRAAYGLPSSGGSGQLVAVTIAYD